MLLLPLHRCLHHHRLLPHHCLHLLHLLLMGNHNLVLCRLLLLSLLAMLVGLLLHIGRSRPLLLTLLLYMLLKLRYQPMKVRVRLFVRLVVGVV